MRYDVNRVGECCWQYRQNGTVLGTAWCEEAAYVCLYQRLPSKFRTYMDWRHRLEMREEIWDEIWELESKRRAG